MISIVTAVYNQLQMNKLFYESLVKYTTLPFELIIIDNGSTDGSPIFFESVGARVIRNDANYMYPHCQNQGIEVAKFEIIAFLNNDLLFSEGWDKKVIQVMDKHNLDIASCCTTDRMENDEITHRWQKKWKYLRNPLLFLFGNTRWNLKFMHILFYGNWEKWTQKRFNQFGLQIQEGFSGSNIIMRRSAIDKIGLWDERIQSADFDLFLRIKSRSNQVGDLRPIKLLLGVYLHHYVRLTLKSKHPIFKDGANRLKITQKWNSEEIQQLLKDLGTVGT